MAGRSDDLDGWASLARPRTFAVVGSAGPGGDAVHDLVELGIPGVRAFAVNTDARHLRSKPIESRDPPRQSASSEAVAAAATGPWSWRRPRRRRRRSSGGSRPFEIVFLLAGLGGGTGSALLPYLARGFSGRPTPCPSPWRSSRSTSRWTPIPTGGRTSRRRSTSSRRWGGSCWPYRTRSCVGSTPSRSHQVFHVRNTYLHSLLTSLVDMIESPSQMNVDLASLKGHLRDSGRLDPAVRRSPTSRSRTAWSPTALAESLLDFTLTDAPSALLHLDGGSNFTLRSLEEVVRAFQGRLGEPRRIVFGTRMHPERTGGRQADRRRRGTRAYDDPPRARPDGLGPDSGAPCSGRWPGGRTRCAARRRTGSSAASAAPGRARDPRGARISTSSGRGSYGSLRTAENPSEPVAHSRRGRRPR